MNKQKYSKGDAVIVREPDMPVTVGTVTGLSPSTKHQRGRAFDGSLQWRYRVKTNDGAFYVDENYLEPQNE